MTSVGIRLVLTEDEGRKLFNDQLPLSGVIERELTSVDGNRWSLLLLDRPFGYQVQNQDTKVFSGFEVERLLIRSRWGGHDIGGSTPTSVFVLISGDECTFDKEPIDPKNLYFEAWATCQYEKSG